MPLLRLADAEREIGGVAVEVLGAGEITGRQAVAMDPADPLDLGGVVAGRESPSMVAYRFKPLPAREPRTLAVHVMRYATQAVVVANVDEARYQVSVDRRWQDARAGPLRRAQQPPQPAERCPACRCGAVEHVGGWPRRAARSVPHRGAADSARTRQGRATCRPLSSRSPIWHASQSWPGKGTLRLPMPAIDLPISRTGVLLHYSPRFKLVIPPGSFRVEPYAEPVTAVLREPAMPPPSVAASSPRGASHWRTPRKRTSTRSSSRPDGSAVACRGILPLDVTFPDFGSTIYLAAELTPEMQLAALGFEFERSRGN